MSSRLSTYSALSLVRQWIHAMRQWVMTSLCFRIQRNSWSSVVHVLRQSSDLIFRFFYVNRWITDPEVDVFRPLVFVSHLFVASPEEYMIWIFWEMTSGCFPFSALLGSTVDTCYVRLRRPFGFHTAENCGVSAVDISFVTQRQILMVQTVWRTIETSQLQYASDRRCPCCACRAAFWWCPDARRRHRRLRSWLRHERMTVAMTLAEMTHHTAPRGPKMARVGEGVEHEQHDGLRAQKPPLPGVRPGCLLDPGPAE